MKHFYLLLFLLMGFFGFSQEQFQGQIIADSIGFTQVNIVNLTQKIGTVNNTKGEFIIDAEEGDKIMFSSVQYEPYQITVTPSILQQTDNKIYLFRLVNELEEVNISNIDLTGNLVEDAANIKTKPFFNSTSFGFPSVEPMTVEDRRLYAASTGGIFTVIDVLSGRMDMLKRMKAIADFELVVANSKKMVRESFFTEDLHIPEEFVEDFIYFCAKDERFEKLVHQRAKLQVIEFFTSKVEDYRSFKEWD